MSALIYNFSPNLLILSILQKNKFYLSFINLVICEKRSQKLVGYTRVLTDYIYDL